LVHVSTPDRERPRLWDWRHFSSCEKFTTKITKHLPCSTRSNWVSERQGLAHARTHIHRYGEREKRKESLVSCYCSTIYQACLVLYWQPTKAVFQIPARFPESEGPL